MAENPDTQEIIVPPSLEEWRALYDAALKFKKIAPWEWMWDSDIFSVQNPLNEEFGYLCVLGRNKESFGLVVYLGQEGLEGYLKVQEGEIHPSNPDALHINKCLSASFEDKEYLTNEDLAVIKNLGLRFSGRNAWPQFQSYRPGYFPWQLTKDEAIYLTICLEQAKEVALRFKESPDMFEPSQPDHYFTRIPQKENGILKWKDGWHKPTFLREMLTIRQAIDESRMENIRHLDRHDNAIWEIDFFYAPAYIAEKGKRPYYPILFLWVDQNAYFILSTHMTAPDRYKVEFIEQCLKVFESLKILPGEIQVRKEELLVYLEPLCQRLDIRVKLVKDLNAIDDARKGMKEFFGKEKQATRYNNSSEEPFLRAEPKISRNEPCPCGSGKKYKKCCGA